MKNFNNSVRLIKENGELENKNKGLNKKVREMEKLFSLLAHDLRSPFNVLLGLTEELVSEHEISAIDQKKYLNELRKQTGNVFDLLINLLSWSEVQMGRRSVFPVNFPLKETVDNIITLLQPIAQKKQINLANEVSKNAIIYADADITQIVIRNLISNSLKFTNFGGTIAISEIIADDLVQVSVADTGIGIKPENIEKLFGSEFYSTLGTNNEKGTGLGLLFCKEMIERQGGTIFASSVFGKGTVITFTTKLARPTKP
ncbi:MAG: HAMP domain-containing sensor histidine kinase [bacterium]|nr:HAMP domain-containing sensor histidine kinase [bacterium]